MGPNYGAVSDVGKYRNVRKWGLEKCIISPFLDHVKKGLFILATLTTREGCIRCFSMYKILNIKHYAVNCLGRSLTTPEKDNLQGLAGHRHETRPLEHWNSSPLDLYLLHCV